MKNYLCKLCWKQYKMKVATSWCSEENGLENIRRNIAYIHYNVFFTLRYKQLFFFSHMYLINFKKKSAETKEYLQK